ncbi:4-hydroxy-tetrahydrodipicolinate reductase [Candidatus Fermentibacteria bacterium]|nr:4-hydroxy-tetrahydrodipicolinate reductase [Candidatus Fermentibacteria bacterium]
MKIGIIGYGKMGHEIERLAADAGHEVVWRLDQADNPSAAALDGTRLGLVDLCVEFTVPAAAAANVGRILAQRGKVVCGTTGWFDCLEAVRGEAREGSGLVYGSNFSLGAHLFSVVVREAAQRFAPFPEYDAAIHEVHHAAKADHPSGTARNLATSLLAALPGKTNALADLGEGPVGPDRLHISSTRVGHVPGVHTVFFDGPFDTIELRHSARSRAGFARGALLAAEWLLDRAGVFTFEHVIQSLVEGR